MHPIVLNDVLSSIATINTQENEDNQGVHNLQWQKLPDVNKSHHSIEKDYGKIRSNPWFDIGAS